MWKEWNESVHPSNGEEIIIFKNFLPLNIFHSICIFKVGIDSGLTSITLSNPGGYLK